MGPSALPPRNNGKLLPTGADMTRSGILPVGSIPEPNMEMYVRGCERWEARYPHCIVFGGDVFEGETFEGETAT